MWVRGYGSGGYRYGSSLRHPCRTHTRAMGFSGYGLGPDSPGPLLVHQQNMNFSNNRLQNIEQKHTSTILNIAGFFLSGPIPSIFNFLLPLYCSECRSCYIITLLMLFFSCHRSLPLRLPPQHGLSDKVRHSILFLTNQFLCTGPPPF